MNGRTGLSTYVFLVSCLAWTTNAARAAPGDVAKTLDTPCRYPAGLASNGQHRENIGLDSAGQQAENLHQHREK